MKLSKTERGFPYAEFHDRYGVKCSIQKSSLAFEEAIWLGVDDPEPKVRAKDAHRFGIATIKQTGWIDYDIPKEVSIHTRMHLTRDMVRELLPMLQKFVKTGEI